MQKYGRTIYSVIMKRKLPKRIVREVCGINSDLVFETYFEIIEGAGKNKKIRRFNEVK